MMMGFALYDLHIPCTKTTSSLLFLERDAVSEAKQIQTACINCGRCVSVCPGHVVPARLATLAEHGDMAGFEKWMVWNAASAVAAVTSVRPNDL